MEFSQSVDALIGLAAFPAEQVLAMSLSKNGLDLDRLWERKCQAVEHTLGLAIWRGGETFDRIGGCDNIKRFLTAVLHGREAPRVIVFVDEIEKAFTGTGTDMSGVKTETKWNRTGDLPDDEGWTGAEIKECARKAWRLKMSLKESAGYIVPVSRSAADQIEEWQGAGLNVPSGVKAQLANVEERLLVKIIGSLTAVDRQSLDEKLRTWLQL